MYLEYGSASLDQLWSAINHETASTIKLQVLRIKATINNQAFFTKYELRIKF